MTTVADIGCGFEDFARSRRRSMPGGLYGVEAKAFPPATRLKIGARPAIMPATRVAALMRDNPFGDARMSSVQDTVFDIIARESGIDRARITPDSTLKGLEIQSLDAVQIIFEIEDHFKITMPDRDPDFDTESVKGLVDAVEKLVAEQTTGPVAEG
jgi:acyl carrier protein